MSPQQRLQHNFSLGQTGEDRACAFLTNKGWRILDQNVRYKSTEIDIIALDIHHDEIVFIEVKTRITNQYGNPSQAVDYKKIKSLEYTAEKYIQEKKLTKDYRFDIIAVLPNSIEHFENVTW